MTRTITTLLAIVALAGFAVAAQPSARPMTDPPEYEEHQAYVNVEGEFVPLEMGNPSADARVWCLEDAQSETLNCAVEFDAVFKHELSLAQWAEFEMDCDGFHWGIRCPGEYCAGPITFWVRSNYEIELSFDGFENLEPIDPDATIDSVIEIKYALSNDMTPPTPDDPAWMDAVELNAESYLIENSYELHWEGWTTNIFACIDVSPCNGPTDWIDPDWAVITATLEDQQPWINEETGEFEDMPDFPFQ